MDRSPGADLIQETLGHRTEHLPRHQQRLTGARRRLLRPLPGRSVDRGSRGPRNRAPAPPPATVDGAEAPVSAPFAGPLRASARTTRGAATGRATPRSLEHLRSAGRLSLEYLRLWLRCERLRAAGRRSLEHVRLRLRCES